MSIGRILVAAVISSLAVAWSASAEEKAPASAGKAVYERDCAQCHGSQGKGDGEEAVYVTPQPQDFTTGVLDKQTDEFLASVIAKGGLANGLPESMPAFPKLSKSEIQGVVAYIRQLGKASGKKATPAPDAGRR